MVLLCRTQRLCFLCELFMEKQLNITQKKTIKMMYESKERRVVSTTVKCEKTKKM